MKSGPRFISSEGKECLKTDLLAGL